MNTFDVFLLTFILSNVLSPINGGNISDVQRIFDNFFSPTVYNKMIRGVSDQEREVTVNVTLSILSIIDLNEVEETLQMMGVLYITWFDERLAWDPDDYNGTEKVHALQNTIWKPEVVVSNPGRTVTLLGHERITTSHYFNGSVHWSVGDLFKSYCSLDVTAYPWDQQTCYINLMVWGYQAHEVKLVTPSKAAITTNFESNGAWELLSAQAIEDDDQSRLQIPVLAFCLQLRRFPLYSVINFLLPVFTLVILNIFAFLIPPSSGEKLSYCITVLLALAVFLTLVSGNLPKNSNKMASLCIFLMFILMMSTLICVCSVISIHLHHKSDLNPPPVWLCRLARKLSCKNKIQHLDVHPTTDVQGEKMANDSASLKSADCSSHGNLTWLSVGQLFDYFSFITTIILLCIAVGIFAYFVMSG